MVQFLLVGVGCEEFVDAHDAAAPDLLELGEHARHW